MPIVQKPFDSYVEKTESCWTWQGAVSGGYGRYRYGSKSMKAHHVAWILAHGSLPALDCRRGGQVIMHSCDNRLCVNPGHLSLGTSTQNIRDAIARKRGMQWAGKRAPRPQLRKFDRAVAREMRASGMGWRKLAAALGVCKATVQEALKDSSHA